jgi:hypothetical protein
MEATAGNARDCTEATTVSSPSIATSAPQFAHVRPFEGGWRCGAMAGRFLHIDSEIKTYPKGKRAANNGFERLAPE